MSDIFYLRRVDPPTTPDAVLAAARESGGCFDLHRVDWMSSFLSTDGGRLLCWYIAPDAESARLALRELGADMSAVWPGRVIGGVGPRDAAVSQVDTLVEVPLEAPYQGGDDELLTRLRSASAGDGEASFRFGFVSNHRNRMVCLLRTTETEAARSALEKAGFPVAAAWACAVVTAETA